MKFFLLILFTSTLTLSADVRSANGTIKFDVNSDSAEEMFLNSTGLGVGVSPSTKLHVNGNALITGPLFIGGSSGSDDLNIRGTIGYQVQTVNANATLSGNTTVLVDTSSDNVIL